MWKETEQNLYNFHGIVALKMSVWVIDCLSFINAIGNLMQLLFSSVSRSKQTQFGKIPVCFTVTLEEACALHYLKDANKKNQ